MKRIINQTINVLAIIILASCSTSKKSVKTEMTLHDSKSTLMVDTMHVVDTIWVTKEKKDSTHASVVSNTSTEENRWEKYTKTSVDERGNPVTEIREVGSISKTLKTLQMELTKVSDSLSYYRSLYEAMSKNVGMMNIEKSKDEKVSEKETSSIFNLQNILLMCIVIYIIYVIYRIYKR